MFTSITNITIVGQSFVPFRFRGLLRRSRQYLPANLHSLLPRHSDVCESHLLDFVLIDAICCYCRYLIDAIELLYIIVSICWWNRWYLLVNPIPQVGWIRFNLHGFQLMEFGLPLETTLSAPWWTIQVLADGSIWYTWLWYYVCGDVNL